ncbi:hypothetical protein CEXT_722361 [Caerostris extrusa]|uniref:Uncharacterized protein n=1 Tax=Caerostris extrusa TaxID=172846 RepID=A0AAV4XKY7_CAEEX|nr:hypothetical protein CEXT_722361 [Caerostris extrusa]
MTQSQKRMMVILSPENLDSYVNEQNWVSPFNGHWAPTPMSQPRASEINVPIRAVTGSCLVNLTLIHSSFSSLMTFRYYSEAEANDRVTPIHGIWTVP